MRQADVLYNLTLCNVLHLLTLKHVKRTLDKYSGIPRGLPSDNFQKDLISQAAAERGPHYFPYEKPSLLIKLFEKNIRHQS